MFAKFNEFILKKILALMIPFPVLSTEHLAFFCHFLILSNCFNNHPQLKMYIYIRMLSSILSA